MAEEFPFLRWRFDFAWPKLGVAVECDGGVYGVTITRGALKGAHMPGRHTQGKGYEEGCRKLNAAAVDGWIVLRYTGRMLEGWKAVEEIALALRDRAAQREAVPGE